MKVCGQLVLQERINDDIRYGLYTGGRFVDLSKELNDNLLCNVRIEIEDRYGNVLFNSKGVLRRVKQRTNNLYDYKVGRDILENVLWENVDNKLWVEIDNIDAVNLSDF